jgi:hypothetical protein
MFRFFIIAFEVLALVTVLRTSFVQYWFTDMQTMLADWMLEVSLVAEKQQLAAFRAQIAPHVQNLNDYQSDYLNSVLHNKSSVTDFNRMYCEGHDKNPFIYGATLIYVCNEIQRTELLKP